MNYYPYHIGDFRSGTVNMSRVERWIYRDLIDVYYDTEKPLPLDLDKVCYAVGASAEEERAAVANLLRFKFKKTDAGYVHERCETEIAAYRSRAETAQENGKKGGRPKKQTATEHEPTRNPLETEEKPSGFSSGSDPVASSPPDITGSKTNQEPRTKNQEKEEAQQHNHRGQSRALDPGSPSDGLPDPPERHVQVSVLLRALGVRPMTGSHPLAAIFANAGATDDQLRAAVDIARQRKPSPEPIPPGYLQPILQDILAPPAARPTATAAARDADRAHTIAVLTGRSNDHERTAHTFDVEARRVD
ncbi:YdaU family protein [Ralstonia syzygii]|uniref:YdaU family protein n=1 Tax=Ralstonia syzygii TaxID=28097 RepID=UPI0018D08361|nr:YdaU family protein [Ralstonia syzygii]